MYPGGSVRPDPATTVEGTDIGLPWLLLVFFNAGRMSSVIVMALSSSFESDRAAKSTAGIVDHCRSDRITLTYVYRITLTYVYGH